MAKLQALNISKSYPVPSGPPLEVLNQVSLSLDLGESAAILGPSGSGKSTLLSILGTLDQPTAGEYTLGDKEPLKLPEMQLAAFRSQHIGFIFQDHHLLPQCTVLENVLIPYLADGQPSQQACTQARQLIERVGLGAREHFLPSQLSGGQRQRVAIARAMIRQPTLLLADEPTGNLDRSAAEAITQILMEMQQTEQTILIAVTHSLRLAEKMQRRYQLDQGCLTAQ